MAVTRYYAFLFFTLILLAGCKGKKKVSLAGDEPVEVNDFIAFFPEVPLSYQLTDSTWQKKEKDSLLISYKIFTQFVPDSILGKVFGKNTKLKIYPLAKVQVRGAETYLFAKTTSSDKKAVFLLSFDKKQQFLAGMPVLRPGASTMMQSVIFDRKYTLTRTLSRRNADGSMSEGKEVYILNADARNFLLILTESLEDKMTELINPIDTLPRKHKYAADYTGAKMNLVSIRDGRNSNHLRFFIHFEKSNGECTGELKGEAEFKSPTVAEYREEGDPCILRFIFTSSAVTLKEVDGCGSRRGLRCSFDGSFTKKKVSKTKVK